VDLFTFDDDYLSRLQERDRVTEEHFVRYFSDLLRIKLRRRLRSKNDIDDVMQEVFVRVFRAIRSGAIREWRKLGSFVNSVCNNVLLEWYRIVKKTEPIDPDIDFPDIHNFENEILENERRALVKSLLRELPKKDARLLRAVFLDERDKDEICRELGIDRNYLRVLLHRAIEKFRRKNKRKPPPPPPPETD